MMKAGLFATAALALPLLAGGPRLTAPAPLLAPAPAEPAPERPRVDWEAPPSCPSQAWFTERVRAYLGRPPTDGARWRVRAHVLPADGEFALTLDVGGEGHELRHHDCTQVAELAASLAAIIIDPLAGVGESFELPPPRPQPPRSLPPPPVQRPTVRARGARAPVQPTVEPQPPSPPATSPATPGAPAPNLADLPPRGAARPSSPRWSQRQLLLSADGGANLGLFPNAAPTLSGALGLDVRAPGLALAGARIEATGGAALAGRFRDAAGTRGGDLWAWSLGLRPCWAPRWGRAELRACAAAGAGQMRGRGVGAADTSLGTQPWIWIGGSLGAAVAVVPRLALFLHLDASGNALRPHFALSDPELRFVTPAAMAQVRVGLELRLF